MKRSILSPLPAGTRLPLAFLHRYTAFLFRRPVSRSNSHYLETRLEGLKSLASLLPHEGVSDIGSVTGLLRRLNVPNFPRLAPQLLERLAWLVRDELPPDVVVTPRSPAGDLLAACRRILVVLGPGIGVGDEIMCFSLPRWLRRMAPGAEVSTLSAYPGLWDRVADVARCRTYGCYGEVVQALRNDRLEAGREAADLVVLVDFEDPALHPLMLPEPGVRLYLEISIGGRSAVLVDCERRWLHRLLLPGPYDVNYYQALWGIAGWLGSRPRPGDRASTLERNGAEPPARRDTELCILVSPFTSKHEPSEDYWSQLLSGAVPRREGGAIRLVFDPGPNAFTRRFAQALARSTEARCPHPVRCEVVGQGEPGPASLQRVFAAMEGAQAVICVDSFAAHAAPLCGCVTLVVGWAGLENWRLPDGPSFYFDGSSTVETVAAAMRHVLDAVGTGSCECGAGPRLTRAQVGLLDAAEHLGEVLSDGGAAAPRALAAACSRFTEAYRAGLDETEIEALGAAELFRDYPYPDLRLPRLPADGLLAASEREEMERHLRHQVRQWRGTNLSKYLELVRAFATSAEAGAR
jgi:hypothetical protein